MASCPLVGIVVAELARQQPVSLHSLGTVTDAGTVAGHPANGMNLAGNGLCRENPTTALRAVRRVRSMLGGANGTSRLRRAEGRPHPADRLNSDSAWSGTGWASSQAPTRQPSARRGIAVSPGWEQALFLAKRPWRGPPRHTAQPVPRGF